MDIISTSTRRTTSPNFTHWAGLAAELVPPFEEHLVICAQCQDTLRQEDTFSQGYGVIKIEP